MSVFLIDNSDETHDLHINNWNWLTIGRILRVVKALPAERLDAIDNCLLGCSPSFEKKDARAISSALRSRVIAHMSANQRIMIDGTLTAEPDDGTFYRNPDEAHRNYSTSREMLERLCFFCETADGFTAY
jgi:hypothetical protein